MQIEKNIAAILQNRLKDSGKTKLKFSEGLGIPRSTLQGYLKGNAGLRSDSIEELAKCLGLTPAQLISGPEYAQAYCAFRISAEFDRLDRLPDTTQQHDPICSFDEIHDLTCEDVRGL